MISKWYVKMNSNILVLFLEYVVYNIDNKKIISTLSYNEFIMCVTLNTITQ